VALKTNNLLLGTVLEFSGTKRVSIERGDRFQTMVYDTGSNAIELSKSKMLLHLTQLVTELENMDTNSVTSFESILDNSVLSLLLKKHKQIRDAVFIARSNANE